MRYYKEFPLTAPGLFLRKLSQYFSREDHLFLLHNHHFKKSTQCNTSFEVIAGIGCANVLTYAKKDPFDALGGFHQKHRDWLFGYFSYDLKNSIEHLSSSHPDGIQLPELYFIQPELVFIIQKNQLKIGYLSNKTDKEIHLLFEKIDSLTWATEEKPVQINLKNRISKNQYLHSVRQLKKHIQAGDIYEINFCQEFYAEKATIRPLETWLKLSEHSPAPFSCYFKLNDKYLLCASPERFLKKEGNRLLSQPIKGTIKRGRTIKEDDALKKQLFHSQKDRSENVMIVDLVRNDLSKTAKKGTVKVEELFGIYSFPQVHQMISTISSELREDIHFTEAIKHAFPMGSMTGAPKIRAMELIEQYESTKRGLYSGAAGYISPEGDFDFNVVIRSILYNQTEKYLSAIFGGAITALSDPEQEYEECLLKASAVFAILK